MATTYSLHPQNPQTRILEQIAAQLRGGAVMLYPTDTVYAIGCDLNAKAAVDRIRHLKRLASDKPLTFLCPSLSNVSHYAWVNDSAYRLMKRLIPGPYTFLLPTTKLVPRLVMEPKRKTTGIRVPDHPVSLGILTALGNPVISTSAYLPNIDEDDLALSEIKTQISQIELFERWAKLVDLIIDDGSDPGYQSSTILDLTDDEPRVTRRGMGWEAIASSGLA
jgi:tRNA threonylcarbamoyl adenosine modification protein (Sua5/YciO/YrdC/YwlC family)